MTTTPPKQLYRYRPFIAPRELDALARSQLWFASPLDFTDPYDCAYDYWFSTLTNDEYGAVLAKLGSTVELPEGLTLDDKQHLVELAFTEIGEKVRGLHQGVCCFCKEWDQQLMWTHNADAHKGFCMELQVGDDPIFSNLHSIKYRNKCPSFSIKSALKRGVPYFIDRLMLSKPKDYKYEKEWRIVNTHGRRLVSYQPETLTGIYFGAKMPHEHKRQIIEVLKGRKVRFYTMLMDKGMFRLDCMEYPKP